MTTDDGIERVLAHITELRPANETEPPVLGVLLIDRSGSMRNVRSETEEALKTYLQDLRECPDAHRMLTSIVSFASYKKIEVPPTRACDLPDSIPYHPNGSTRLYATVAETLESVLFEEDRLSQLDRTIRIVLVVMTDGGDNHEDAAENAASVQESRRTRLVSIARHALERGHTLLTFGLGVDAVEIAAAMGFPTDSDHAFSVKKTREGIRETMHYTMASMIGLGGFSPASPSTPR